MDVYIVHIGKVSGSIMMKYDKICASCVRVCVFVCKDISFNIICFKVRGQGTSTQHNTIHEYVLMYII